MEKKVYKNSLMGLNEVFWCNRKFTEIYLFRIHPFGKHKSFVCLYKRSGTGPHGHPSDVYKPRVSLVPIVFYTYIFTYRDKYFFKL